MDTDFETLCARAGESSATVLDNLTHIETALTELQREVAGLPFFVRGFVSSEVTRGTGQDVPAWAQSVGNLTAALREAEAAVERTRAANTVSDADRSIMGQAAERIEAERPRLEGLADARARIHLAQAPPAKPRPMARLETPVVIRRSSALLDAPWRR